MTKEKERPQWFNLAAKVIFTGMVAGLGPFVFEIYSDVKDLMANDRVQDQKIKSVELKAESTAQKIDDLHWYFIKKNNVKVPNSKGQ